MSVAGPPERALWCELWWRPEGIVPRARLVLDGDRIAGVEANAEPRPGDERLAGLALPGLVSAHSHAFHRALRGRTHTHGGDFWTWRDGMLALAERLEPDTYRRLATAVFAEMTLAGITTVGEFHYLHHGVGGRPYDDACAMDRAVVDAAGAAGIRLTLLDTCYLRGGFTRGLDAHQLRFSDRTVDAWAARSTALAGAVAGAPRVRVGAAIHSVRTVGGDDMAVVAELARARGWPLHLHLSEQPAENEASLSAAGKTPTTLAAEAGVLGPETTAVHATHVTPDDVALLGASATGVCLCPTTERDLADGIGPAAALVSAGCPLSLGSDSNALVDLFEEARAVELNERLISGRRGLHDPVALLGAATRGGRLALGWPADRADIVALDLDSPRLAGGFDAARTDPGGVAAAVVFAATAADVRSVVVGGEIVVRDGVHARLEVGPLLRDAIAEVVA